MIHQKKTVKGDSCFAPWSKTWKKPKVGLLEAAISECERENVDGEARDLWTGQLVSFVWDVGGRNKKDPNLQG